MRRSVLQLVGTRSRAIRRSLSMQSLITNSRGFNDGFIRVIGVYSWFRSIGRATQERVLERVPTSCNARRPDLDLSPQGHQPLATSNQPLTENLERLFQVIRPENQKPFC